MIVYANNKLKRHLVSHFLHKDGLDLPIGDNNKCCFISDIDKSNWLKWEKQQKQPYFSNFLQGKPFDMEEVWITFVAQLEKLKEHYFDVISQMTSKKFELSCLDDLFTYILTKVVEENYHHKVVTKFEANKWKVALE